jgi:phage protein D
MSSSYQLLLNGRSADTDLYTLIASVEVEESMDLPAAVQIQLPISRDTDGELTFVTDAQFAPFASIAVVATAGGSGVGGVLDGAAGAVADVFGGGAAPSATQCIFDGYVLSQKIHLETGTTNATMTVWGQDASWLMNATERVKEWVDVTDADVASAIFADYDIEPAEENTDDDSATHTEDGHSLMQRGSDIQFLRMLARRNGKVCRIACADQPGVRTGYFAKPSLDGDPVATLALNDLTNWTVRTLDIEWDATRPSAVVARQALFSDPDEDGATGDADGSGLDALGDRALADFTGQAVTVLLTAPVDDAGELSQRARAVLRETNWFVRCEGEADVDRLGIVLRAGMIIALSGIGAVHSGNYLVWNVRHRITPEAHSMKFVLLRNAVGAAPAGGAGGLAALVGAG